jgi:hypothetical protein
MRGNSIPPTPSTLARLTPGSDASLSELTEGLASLDLDSMAQPDNADLLQQLVAALTATNKDRETSSKAIRWPEWDGTKDGYAMFKWTVESKIEQENGRLGSNKAICTNIFACLPKEKQQRVIYWLQEGGEDGSYNPNEFLEHMDSKFLDPEEERKALDKLDRVRQGDRQKFEDFRQQFEQLSAQAGTLAHKGASKVSTMRRAISTALSRLLISVELSNTDYESYVVKVQKIATNFEAHKDFHKQSGSMTHYYVNEGSHRSTSRKRSNSTPAQDTDGDGDTEMTDVKALATKVAALVAQVSSISRGGKEDKRPRAKWRSGSEFRKLIKAGKCGRCKEKKHDVASQCKFRPAARPNAQVTAVATHSTDDDLDELSSGSEN